MNFFSKCVFKLICLGCFNWLGDKAYLKMLYRTVMGKKLNLDNPKTFNEKLQWLKLYDRNPEYTVAADKYAVREYIANTIGEEYLIPLIGVWDSPDEINFDSLPNKFAMKCNHNSGLGMVICKDKSKLDYDEVKKNLKKGLKQNYYKSGREWPYKNIKRKIICEEFIGENDETPADYKFFCFNGVPDNVMICLDRDSGTTKFYFFDMQWKLLRYNGWGMRAPDGFTIDQPKNFDKMVEIATVLSKPYKYSRIDLYNVNGKIYFGEITFFPDSGLDGNIIPQTDDLLGEKLDLS